MFNEKDFWPSQIAIDLYENYLREKGENRKRKNYGRRKKGNVHLYEKYCLMCGESFVV